MKHPVTLRSILGYSEKSVSQPERKGYSIITFRQRQTSPCLPFTSVSERLVPLAVLGQTEVLAGCFGALELVLQLSFPLMENYFTVFFELPSVGRAKARSDSESCMAACLLILRIIK